MPLTQPARSFYSRYLREHATYVGAAVACQQKLAFLLEEAGIDVHVVEARAKDPPSVIAKIRRKNYGQPARQLTDALGARIIAYYSDEVDPIVDVIESNLDIDKRRTEDKRVALRLREFGYRSVHLIAKWPAAPVLGDVGDLLANRWFEIQVRDVLEHAWAETEHELIYKSGIMYPEEVRRRYSALAGALEILDGELIQLRNERARLINAHTEEYVQGLGLDQPLDGARLLGFLQAVRPGPGIIGEDRTPFPPKLLSPAVDALAAVGISSADDLQLVLGAADFKRNLASFAADEALGTEEISDLAVVMLAIGTRNLQLLQDEFPDMAQHPSLERLTSQ